MNLQVGLYGGCFNPVHEGHIAAARGACNALQLDRVIFIPSGHPPLKGDAGLAEGTHRLNMLQLALADDARFSTSAIEIERSGPSYTVDTVRYFHNALPDKTQLFFLLGDDCIARLPRWKGIDELHTMVRFAVLPRESGSKPYDDPRLIRLALPRFAVSSTQIRAICAAGEIPGADLLHPDAARYIARHSLYQTVERRIHA